MPGRENGGNCDIKNLTRGSKVGCAQCSWLHDLLHFMSHCASTTLTKLRARPNATLPGAGCDKAPQMRGLELLCHVTSV